jgi:hypothetical protein
MPDLPARAVSLLWLKTARDSIWITGTEKPPAERIPVAAPDFKLHKQQD